MDLFCLGVEGGRTNIKESIRSTVHSTLSQNPQGKAPKPCGICIQSSEVVLGVAASREGSQPDKARGDTAVRRIFHQSWGGTNLTIIFVRTLKSKHPTYLSEPQWKVNLGSFSHTSGLKEAGVVGLQRHWGICAGFRVTPSKKLARSRIH